MTDTQKDPSIPPVRHRGLGQHPAPRFSLAPDPSLPKSCLVTLRLTPRQQTHEGRMQALALIEQYCTTHGVTPTRHFVTVDDQEEYVLYLTTTEKGEAQIRRQASAERYNLHVESRIDTPTSGTGAFTAALRSLPLSDPAAGTLPPDFL